MTSKCKAGGEITCVRKCLFVTALKIKACEPGQKPQLVNLSADSGGNCKCNVQRCI